MQIKVSDFNEDEFGTLIVKLGENEYKSVQPSNNLVILPASICKGEKIYVQVKTKDPAKTAYFLEAKLTNNKQTHS